VNKQSYFQCTRNTDAEERADFCYNCCNIVKIFDTFGEILDIFDIGD